MTTAHGQAHLRQRAAARKESILGDAELLELAVQVGRRLSETGRHLVTAESCTAGWVAKALTDVSGSSAWFLGGVVAYSNELKQRLLNVTATTLVGQGAVSEATVREMATGALQNLGGEIALSVSGIAGPAGGQPGKPVGTVWFAWAWRQSGVVQVSARHEWIPGDREQVRRRSVQVALTGILEI